MPGSYSNKRYSGQPRRVRRSYKSSNIGLSKSLQRYGPGPRKDVSMRPRTGMTQSEYATIGASAKELRKASGNRSMKIGLISRWTIRHQNGEMGTKLPTYWGCEQVPTPQCRSKKCLPATVCNGSKGIAYVFCLNSALAYILRSMPQLGIAFQKCAGMIFG